MRDRIGVIRHSPAAGDSRELILPSGEIIAIGPDLSDADIAERFGLDAIRYSAVIDWCRATCCDGPMAGTFVYAENRIGSKVMIGLPPRLVGAVMEYEVTQLSIGASSAELRLSRS